MTSPSELVDKANEECSNDVPWVFFELSYCATVSLDGDFNVTSLRGILKHLEAIQGELDAGSQVGTAAES
jgi:hypothetical protein